MPRAWKRFAEYSLSTQNKCKRFLVNDSINHGQLNGESVCDTLNDDVSALDQSVSDSSEGNDLSSEPDKSVIDESSDEVDCNDSNSIRSNGITEQCDLICVEKDTFSEAEVDFSNEREPSNQNVLMPGHIDNGFKSEDELNDGSSEFSSFQSESSSFQLPSSDNEEYESDESAAISCDNNEPLYNGAPLSSLESTISILNLALRHNITDALLLDTLNCIALHCPPENRCETTLFKFKKHFADIKPLLHRHYYCKFCLLPLETKKTRCPLCRNDSENSYFIDGGVVAQLKVLYKRVGFYDLVQHRLRPERQHPHHFSDIYDGMAYEDLVKNGGFLSNPNNISFMLYTDGIRIFKSSKFNIWPVYLSINELPFKSRLKKENVIFAGLWFGDEKPFPNLFLRPLEQSMRELHEGIEVLIPNVERPLLIRAIIICITCDLPAKALFLNMNQYNGRFGCQKCKDEGRYLRAAKVRVYPYRDFDLRTEAETLVNSKQAMDVGFAVCGVKGPSILKFIVHEYIRATAVDSMHCVFEGVVKNLLSFWFSPEFADHIFSLAQYNGLISQRIKLLTPPSFIQRCPRSIRDNLPYLKAHELKAWFFYYSIPCLEDIMAKKYFDHYLLLVQGVSLLYQTSISRGDVAIAYRAIHEFVSKYELVYGLRYMNNNVHQLLHLPENVVQFGPLWITACFAHEDLNGRLKNMVHGSNAAQLQIYSTITKFLHLTALKAENLVEGRPAYEFCESLDSKRGRMRRHRLAPCLYIIGKCTQLAELPDDIDRIFARANVTGLKYFYFTRLLRDDVLYSGSEYKRSMRTNSSFTAYTAQDGRKLFGRILCFVRISNCPCRTLCECISSNYAVVKRCIVQNKFSTCIDRTMLNNIHTVLDFENHEEIVEITDLMYVCFYCHIVDTSAAYCIEPVNQSEWE